MNKPLIFTAALMSAALVAVVLKMSTIGKNKMKRN